MHVSSKFHMVFDDEFSTVLLMREGTLSPKWIDLVQHISQIGAPKNITPSHEPSVAPDKNDKKIASSQSVPHVQEGPDSKEESFSEVIQLPVSEVFQNISNLNKVFLAQQSSNAPSGMPYHEG